MLENKEMALKIIFFAIFVFSALRYGIGYDYYTYLWCCSPNSEGVERFELIPRILAVLSQMSFPYLFFILTSLFISYFYYMGIKKGGAKCTLEVLFYIGFPFFFLDQLGIIRQGMASAIVFLAIAMKYSKYEGYRLLSLRAVLLILAVLCHKSAILSIFILLPWEKVSQKFLWIMYIGSLMIGSLITSFLDAVLSMDFLMELGFIDENDTEYAMDYFHREAHGEGKIIKWLIYLIGVLSLFLYDRLVRKVEKNAYYIGVLVFGISLYALFSYNSTLSKRFCMFFFSSSIFIVPQIFSAFKLSNKFYTSMCALLFMLQVYIGSFNVRPQDNNGSSVTYPYRTYIDKCIK